MVELAKVDLEAAGVHAEVGVGDAMAPEFDHSNFDLIAASLVLFFLPDPEAALRAWRGLLVDGGRVGVSTFGPFSEPWRAVHGVFRPYLPAEPLASAAEFVSDAAVESLLRQSGFANPRTATRELAVRFESKEHWHEWSWSQEPAACGSLCQRANGLRCLNRFSTHWRVAVTNREELDMTKRSA